MPSPNDSDRSPPGRRVWMFGGMVLMVIVALVAARPALAWWARRSAADHLQAGRISQAEQWLTRAARLNSDNTATRVLIARSYRHLDQRKRWQEAIERAEADATAGSEVVGNEKRLGALQWGEAAKIADDEWERLDQSGVDRDEAAMAVAHGLLLAGNDQQLAQLLSAWEEATDHPQQVAYLRGIVSGSKQNRKQAQLHLQKAVNIEPEHEMARAALARVLEYEGDFPAALEHYAYWAQHRPGNQQAVTGWSRVLRLLGRADEARNVMQQLAPAIDDSTSVALEWAQVESALGNHDEAVRWFQRADLDGPHQSSTIRTAATAFALNGNALTAETMFDRVMSVQDRQRRIEELEKRVINDPGDQKALDALQEISEPPVGESAKTPEASQHPVSPLFSEHCGSCHGRRGDANGPGSRHLYPPARNLLADSYRFVTGTNRQPLPNDIESVIRDGIPGTAMPSFAELSEKEIEALTEQVYQLRREGMRRRLMEQFRSVGEPMEEETVDEIVRQRLDRVSRLEVPEMPELSSESRLAEGRQLYEQAGCVQCHGPDGHGAFDVPLFNEDGTHAIPRDIVREPWKGGESPEALFARIRLGMPGTPHPENPTLEDEQLLSLVAYCLSISSENKMTRTNRQRAILANQRAIQARFGADP